MKKAIIPLLIVIFLIGLNCNSTRSNQIKDAHKWYRKGIDLSQQQNYEQALEAYNMSLKLNPNDEETWVCKSYVLNALGRYHEAITACNWALAASREPITIFNMPMTNPSVEKLAWNNRGYALMKLGNYLSAYADFSRALETDPHYLDALNSKGECLKKLNQPDQALIVLGKAIEIDPKNANAYYRRAAVYSGLNNKKNTLEDLGKAIELDSINRTRAKKNTDFQWLWGDEEFKKIVGSP